MGADDLGNVVISRPFQFAEIQQVVVDLDEGEDIFTPSLPKALTKIEDRYIYAFELGERDGDRKPILIAEYHADPHGMLTMIHGPKRRKMEPNPALPGASVPAAALPLVRQGKRLRHVFVAMRGQASTAAILDMEDHLHPIYDRVNLADDFYFKKDKGTAFLPIIDPLTLGEQLNVAYQKALNAAINYTVPYELNEDRAQAELNGRKYQLAKMIKDSLFRPNGHHDPLDLADHLGQNGGTLLSWIDTHESKLRRYEGQKHYRADQLVRMLNSGIWNDARRWYLGTKDATNQVGHCWLDATFCSCDRLGEVPVGRKLIGQLLKDYEKGGLLSYIFAPPEEQSELFELYKQRFPIMRKAATAAVIGFAEMAPAIALYFKTRGGDTIIKRTWKAFFGVELAIERDLLSGALMARLKIELRVDIVRIELKKPKVNLEHWIEDGKPHWPERTKASNVAELMGRLFIVCETINLCNAINEIVEKLGGQDSKTGAKIQAGVELVGATLDLVVAAEDPIRAYAHELDRIWAKAPGATAPDAAKGVSAAAKEEAEGIFTKVTKPGVFKGLGAASAAIDMVVYFLEAKEDIHKGDRQMAFAHGMVSAGSGLILIASVADIVGYAQSVALTAAASTLMVVGVVIVVVGFVLVAYFSKSTWQKFARHCVFGVESASKGGKGEEAWSGGDFSTWTNTNEGIDKQIEVLTAMLCSFKVSGAGLADYEIYVDLNAVPPNGRLELNFSYSYENGRGHNPGYVVDLTGSESIAFHGDAHASPGAFFTYEGEEKERRLARVRVSAQGPGFQSRVHEARCKVRVLYAPGTGAEVANGQIPIEGVCNYLIRDSTWGMSHMEPIDSLSVEPEEKREKKSEKPAGEEEEIQPGIPM